MSPKSILIAEDESLIAEELRDRLQRMGLMVAAIVSTGEQAIAQAETTAPSLVLMDIRLKGPLDGIEAAAKIREKFNVPVVYLTAHSDNATIERAKQTQPYGYLLKPLGERELKITIEMALHKHQMEHQLAEATETYVATLASIGDGVIATDSATRVTFMNSVAEGLTGWRSSDALGKPFEEIFKIIRGTTGSAVPNPVVRALNEAAIVGLPADSLLLTKDGGGLAIDDLAAPIRDSKEVIRGAVIVFRDVRQRQEQEKALKDLDERRRQAQKMEALGRLAGGVAHDINNLMTAVIGYGELLLARIPVDHPWRESILAMKDSGDRAARISRQLLTFSRQQPHQPVVLPLNDTLRNLEKMLARMLGEDVELVLELGSDVGRVKIDPSQLEQVILNLAINARDAMPQGGRLLLATSSVVSEKGFLEQPSEPTAKRFTCMTVSDTGVGMDDATRERIFEPFFTTKAAGKGTGLGLATVHGIVHTFGGDIVVESRPGEGATFKVYLPEVAELPSAIGPHLQPIEALRGTETILVVEDDETLRRLERKILEVSGYRVLEAVDGASALELFERRVVAIDLLLTDVVLPKLNGWQLIEKVRQLDAVVKFVAMSGYVDRNLVGADTLGSGVPYLQKPFSPTQLLKKIRLAFDGAIAEDAAAH